MLARELATFERLTRKKALFIEEMAQFNELCVIEIFSLGRNNSKRKKFLIDTPNYAVPLFFARTGIEVLEHSRVRWLELAEDRFVLLSNGH